MNFCQNSADAALMDAPRGRLRVLTLCVALTTWVAAAPAAPAPAVVFVHGHIYTAEPAHSWAQALRPSRRQDRGHWF